MKRCVRIAIDTQRLFIIKDGVFESKSREKKEVPVIKESRTNSYEGRTLRERAGSVG